MCWLLWTTCLCHFSSRVGVRLLRCSAFLLLHVVGHLDTRRSIQRVIAVTFTVSFAYSLTQVRSYRYRMVQFITLLIPPLQFLSYDVYLEAKREDNLNWSVLCSVHSDMHIGVSSFVCWLALDFIFCIFVTLFRFNSLCVFPVRFCFCCCTAWFCCVTFSVH